MVSAICSVLMVTLGANTCPLPDASAGTRLDYSHVKGYILSQGDPRLVRFAPIIAVEGYDKEYNRVGTPSARYAKDGDEDIFVDLGHATYYTEVRDWKTDRGHYTNLIYRVHFQMSKDNSKSTDGGKGYNTGLIVIVTLDDHDQPILLNTVQTCGCFHAIIPTSFLPKGDYPDEWDTHEFTTYREHLPGLLRYPEKVDEGLRPAVFLRDGSHRVADVQMVSEEAFRQKYGLVEAKEAAMDSLYHLPLGKGETSFFYTEGKNKGLVKGAYKKKEFILAPLIGDSRVGQDRAYGSRDEVPRGFYTTLNPSDKDDSDMWNYEAFLKENGWKL